MYNKMYSKAYLFNIIYKSLIYIFLLFVFLLVAHPVYADILLSGQFHAGDNYFSILNPPDPVTYTQLENENYPIQFALSEERTLTGIELLNVQDLESDSNLRIFINGNEVASGGDGQTSVSFASPVTLGEGLHTFSVRGSCYNNQGKEQNNCQGSKDEDDFDFDAVNFYSADSEPIINIIERVHLGDWTDDDWYDPTDTYPYYPDDPQGENITFSFSIDETAYGLDLDFYRLRALDYVADIEIDTDDEGSLDPNSGQPYNLDDPYSLSISKTLKPGSHSINISAGISGGNVDDFSWDELIITPKRLLSYYAMEESTWNGTPGEVADSTENNHNATAYGDADTQINDPAIPGSNGTCRYGKFDGENDYVEDSDAANYLEGLSAITIMAWVKNTDNIGNDRGVFGTALPNTQDNRLGLRYDDGGSSTGNNNLIKASINTNACDDTNDCLQVETESDLQVQDEWQHIAMTWQSGEKIRIYVDGNEVSTTVTSSGIGTHEGMLDGIDFLRIGQGVKNGNPSPYWRGSIDEFRVFGQALDKSQIQSIKNKTHPCDISNLDHYSIDVGGGTASTCFPRTITITAKDNGNNTITDYTEKVDLSTNSGHGSWSKVSAEGTLNDPTSDDGAATYSFVDSDNGSIDLDLLNQHADDLTITVTEDDGSPSSTSEVLSFRHNAFVFNSTDTLDRDIVAGRDHELSVTLWRRNPSNGNCYIANAYNNASQPIKLWINRDADDPSGSAPNASGVTSTPLPDSEPGSNNIELDFSANSLQAGRAPFTLSTSDVGKYSFSIKDETSGFAQNETGTPRAINGSSSNFVVRPFAFDIDFNDDRADNPDNCGIQTSCAQNASGDVFTRAGADFSTTVTAVLWQSADDNNDDGRPNSGANLGDNAATPSFGQEGDGEAESVNLTRHLVAPSGGDNGTLTGGTFTASEFSSGSATHTLSWSEVGIIDLNATLSDRSYMVSGPQLRGRAPNVGRFTPDHFQLTNSTASFRNTCYTGGFTYIGQSFYYYDAPEITLTAENSANGTTRNYGGDFWKFEVQNDYLANRTYQDQANASAFLDASKQDNATVSGHRDFDGNATFALHNSTAGDKFLYERNGTEEPFDGRVDLRLSKENLKDKDNVCYQANGTCSNYLVENIEGDDLPGADLRLRYGRLILENAYGSELLNLEVPIRAEYYDGGGFTTHADDQCTRLTMGNSTEAVEMELKNEATDWKSANKTIYLAGNQASGFTKGIALRTNATSNATTLTFDDGTASLVLDAPEANNTGYVHVRANLDNHPWLQYDWNGNGNNTDNPNATATFGIYKGNEHVIYQQETTWK